MAAESGSKPPTQKYLDPKDREECPGAGEIWNMNCEFCSTRKIKCSREASCTHCNRRGAPCKYPSIAKPVNADERESNRKDSRFKKRKHDRAALDTREPFPNPTMGPWGSMHAFPGLNVEGGGGAAGSAALGRFGVDLSMGMAGAPFWQPSAQGGAFVSVNGDVSKRAAEDRTPDGGDRPMLWSKSCEFCASRKIWCSRESGRPYPTCLRPVAWSARADNTVWCDQFATIAGAEVNLASIQHWRYGRQMHAMTDTSFGLRSAV
eukprot:917850-Rhodomonas_salina.2